MAQRLSLPSNPSVEIAGRDAVAARVVCDVLDGEYLSSATLKVITSPEVYTDAVKHLNAAVPRYRNARADIIGAWLRNIDESLRPLAFVYAFRLFIPLRARGSISGPVTLETIRNLPVSEVRDALLAALGYFDWDSSSRGVRAAAVLGMIGRASLERAL